MRNIEPPAKSKMAARGPKNGRRGLEMGPTLGYWPFEPLSLNKFFDPSTPSIRKGRDGEKLLFRGVICCSGGLYAVVQGRYMLFRGVIWVFRGVIYAVQGGYMRKIMATIIVASRPPNDDRLQRRPLVPT